MNTNLDFALFYAQKKVWPIFPLVPGDKYPLIKGAHEEGNPCKGECGKLGHGLHDATTKLDLINDWWSKNPKAGIGVATGKRAGVFVLDIDKKPAENIDGEIPLRELIDQHGSLPETVSQHTGGGGMQYFFQYPQGVDIANSTGKNGGIAPGIDIRGEGGYVAIPPSGHKTGNKYQWVNEPSQTVIAHAPTWLVHLIVNGKAKKNVAPSATNTGVFLPGDRNSSLLSMAGAMRRRGFDQQAIFEALKVENANKCNPPLPENEVLSISSSVSRYAPTDAPVTENRNRQRAEWSFCRVIYEYPDELDYVDITPDAFFDPRLRTFLTLVQSGIFPVEAATKAECLSDLEDSVAWSFLKVSEYVNVIKEFSYYEKIAHFAKQLMKAADTGDAQKVSDLTIGLNQISERNAPGRGIFIRDVDVRSEVLERSKNPADVWGIPYAWPKISSVTGGKQKGELIMMAGEPGIGKSWWALQDALETARRGTPTWIWSGEMRRKQIKRRLYRLLGVDGRNMNTGRMTERDWDAMSDADKLLDSIPLRIDDEPMTTMQARAIIRRETDMNGLEYFVADYAFLIGAPGRDEIERSAAVSVEMKRICNDGNLPLAGLLLSSVNKAGMDGAKETGKANMRGSGQQLHDADIVYFLTEFAPIEGDSVAIRYLPADHLKINTLHIKKGRELDKELPGQRLHFSRIKSPIMIEEVQR